MEVKNSKKTKLTGLFGKYILGFTAIVILLAFFCFFVMIGTVTMIGGLLLPANHAEQVLAENGDKIRNADMVTEDLIPAGTFYGVFLQMENFFMGILMRKKKKLHGKNTVKTINMQKEKDITVSSGEKTEKFVLQNIL